MIGYQKIAEPLAMGWEKGELDCLTCSDQDGQLGEISNVCCWIERHAASDFRSWVTLTECIVEDCRSNRGIKMEVPVVHEAVKMQVK